MGKGLLVLAVLVLLIIGLTVSAAFGDSDLSRSRETRLSQFGSVFNGLRTIGGFSRGYFPGAGMMGGMMGGCGARSYLPEEGQIGSIDLEAATKLFKDYAVLYGNSDLEVAEVMEFSNHFYAELVEKSTGTFAMELILDKYTGRIYPEMGPNMMWNLKYGHMGGAGMMGWGLNRASPSEPMPVSPEKAVAYAQAYLDQTMPGSVALEPHAFYGYYTLHVETDGKITGMLSINGYTGQVWYHNWHGPFVQMSKMGSGHQD